MRRDLCESAKKGKLCVDDLCRGVGETLCRFDKELYDEMLAETDPTDFELERQQQEAEAEWIEPRFESE